MIVHTSTRDIHLPDSLDTHWQQRNTMTTENTERDKLGKLLFTLPVSDRAAETAPEIMRLCDEAAEAILAAGYTKPKQVTTVAELDALGFQAVVLDAYDTPHVCERFRTDGKRAEWQPSGMNQLLESEDILYHGPATVLHSPVVGK